MGHLRRIGRRNYNTELTEGCKHNTLGTLFKATSLHLYFVTDFFAIYTARMDEPVGPMKYLTPPLNRPKN